MELIVAFKNTHFVISAEQAALAGGIKVSVMPLPSSIRAGCGLCLRVESSRFAELKLTLTENRILYSGVYQRRDGVYYNFFEGGNEGG